LLFNKQHLQTINIVFFCSCGPILLK
jgi:hypothetical protein